jgi:hypothetical protein
MRDVDPRHGVISQQFDLRALGAGLECAAQAQGRNRAAVATGVDKDDAGVGVRRASDCHLAFLLPPATSVRTSTEAFAARLALIWDRLKPTFEGKNGA